MALEFTISITGATFTQSGEFLRLYHGTDFESANCIKNYGLDPAKALQGGGEGFFWCTPDMQRAKVFAIGTLSNKPTIVKFDLPVVLVNDFLDRNPPWVHVFPVGATPNLRFQSESFAILSEQMTNVIMTEASMTFTEKQ